MSAHRVLVAAASLGVMLALAPALGYAQTSAAPDAPVATGKGQSAPPTTPQTEVQSAYDDSAWAPEVSVKREVERKPHGFIGAGIGTGGYRQVYGAVDLPIGETGDLIIAIDDTHFNGSNGRPRR